MKRLISRTLLWLMIAAALGMMAFGPRPPSNGQLGRIHIQYWEKWTGLEAQQMKQVVDAFNDTVGREKISGSTTSP